MYSLIDLAALTVVFLGITAQAYYGIGFGLISAPLLFLLDPAYLPAPILILGFVLALVSILRTHVAGSANRVWFAIGGRALGSWLGALLVAVLSGWMLDLGFGVALLVAVLISYTSLNIHPRPRNLIIAGFFSGVLGTSTSIGGPPMAVVYQNSHPATARNELSLFFLWGTMLSILSLIATDNLKVDSLILAMKLLPAVFAGFVVASFLEAHLSIQSVKKVFAFISIISAILIIGRGCIDLLRASTSNI